MPFKRGAPKGNTNRLKHGLYSRAGQKRRADVRAQVRKLKNLAIKATLVLHARRVLRLKRERTFFRTCHGPQKRTTQVTPHGRHRRNDGTNFIYLATRTGWPAFRGP
jgi:hypothetical protein